MSEDLVKRLGRLLEKATGTGKFEISGLERPLPWEVWTSNSFRRVKTARGFDVLSGYRCQDGCVDLSMPEDRLVALIEIVNALPTLLERLTSHPGEDAASLADVIEAELSRWKGANGGIYSIRAAAIHVARLPALSPDPQKEALVEALKPFAKVMADIITNREDDEAIDGSLAADRITWGDLRRAKAALSSTLSGGLDCG